MMLTLSPTAQVLRVATLLVSATVHQGLTCGYLAR